MTNPNFDWIMLLPEGERKTALAKRDAANEAFFKGFPLHPGSQEAERDAAELRRAGEEGCAIFERACAIVDKRNETERLLNTAMDHIAGTLEQPSDSRAWDHLLIYCPHERLEAELKRRSEKSP